NLQNVDLELTDKSCRDVLAIMSQSDCIVTNIQEYVPFINVFNKPSIICQGPADLSGLVKHATVSSHKNGKSMVYLVDNKEKFGCMPCTKEPMERCRVNGSFRSQCMVDFNVGQIFSRVVNVEQILKSQKKMQKIAAATQAQSGE